MKTIKRKIFETVYYEETGEYENITTEYFINLSTNEISNIIDNLKDNQKLFLPHNSIMNVRNSHFIPEKFNLNMKFDFLPVFFGCGLFHHITEKKYIIQLLTNETFFITTTEPIEMR